MAVEVVMPVLGLTVEKGKILKWRKGEGEVVRKGEILFEIEADKVTTEVESPATGILGRILVWEDREVPVLTVLAVITKEGEDLPDKYRIQPAVGKPAAPEAVPPPPAPAAMRKESAGGWDIAVVGAGPGGYVSAIRAAQLGARVLLVEKAELGGTCLNKGCIPTKSFLADVKIWRKVKTSEVFENRGALTLNWGRMVSKKNRVVETLRRGISLLLESQGVQVVKGKGILLDPKTIQVVRDGRPERFESRSTILATGSRPGSLPMMKTDGKRVLSSDDVLEKSEFAEEVLIVGGGAIGVEWAAILNGLGSKVTVLEMRPQIIPTEDGDLARELEGVMKKDGIRVLTRAKVLSASPANDRLEVQVEIDGRQERISTRQAIVAVGREPHTEDLNLEGIGVQMEGKFIRVNARMETNVEGIYAVGDVIGKMMLAHAASAEGLAAVENIAGRAREVDYRRIPNCIYSFPELASVGWNEADARRQGYRVHSGKFPYRRNGKALAMGETEGWVKIVAEEELGEVLGVHIIGESATELIGECLLGLQAEAVVDDLAEVVKGHPTLSEMIMEAALDWKERAIHLPRTSSRQAKA